MKLSEIFEEVITDLNEGKLEDFLSDPNNAAFYKKMVDKFSHDPQTLNQLRNRLINKGIDSVRPYVENGEYSDKGGSFMGEAVMKNIISNTLFDSIGRTFFFDNLIMLPSDGSYSSTDKGNVLTESFVMHFKANPLKEGNFNQLFRRVVSSPMVYNLLFGPLRDDQIVKKAVTIMQSKGLTTSIPTLAAELERRIQTNPDKNAKLFENVDWGRVESEFLLSFRFTTVVEGANRKIKADIDLRANILLPPGKVFSAIKNGPIQISKTIDMGDALPIAHINAEFMKAMCKYLRNMLIQ